MFGTEIQRKLNRIWINSGISLGLGSILFGILKGPSWIYVWSSLGCAAGLVNLALYLKKKDRFPGVMSSLLLTGSHLLLLATALILARLFLSPLPDSTLKCPKLGHLYKDPSGLFTVKGPVGWDYLTSPAGVKIKPQTFDQYMGAAEIDVQIRRLEKAPLSAPDFLRKMATSMTSDRRPLKGKKVLHLKTSLIQTLDKDTGIWLVLDVFRWWIPLRESSLFGIKKKLYFCSVAATGLAAHSTLHQVLCLGIYQTLEVSPAH